MSTRLKHGEALLHRSLWVAGADDDDPVAGEHTPEVAKRPLRSERELVAVETLSLLVTPVRLQECEVRQKLIPCLRDTRSCADRVSKGSGGRRGGRDAPPLGPGVVWGV